MATHSSVLAWRIPGTGEPGGLLSLGLHRVGHDWSDLAAAATFELADRAEQTALPVCVGLIQSLDGLNRTESLTCLRTGENGLLFFLLDYVHTWTWPFFPAFRLRLKLRSALPRVLNLLALRQEWNHWFSWFSCLWPQARATPSALLGLQFADSFCRHLGTCLPL